MKRVRPCLDEGKYQKQTFVKHCLRSQCASTLNVWLVSNERKARTDGRSPGRKTRCVRSPFLFWRKATRRSVRVQYTDHGVCVVVCDKQHISFILISFCVLPLLKHNHDDRPE